MKKLMLFGLMCTLLLGICATSFAQYGPTPPTLPPGVAPTPGRTKITLRPRVATRQLSLVVHCFYAGGLCDARISVTEISSQGIAVGSPSTKTATTGSAIFFISKNKNYRISASRVISATIAMEMGITDIPSAALLLFDVQQNTEIALELGVDSATNIQSVVEEIEEARKKLERLFQ